MNAAAALGHPEEEMLVAHAAGQTMSGERLVVEAHLVFCPACRAAVRDLLEPGGATLADVEPQPVPAGVWESLRAQVAVASPVGGPRGERPGDGGGCDRGGSAAAGLGPLPAELPAELAVELMAETPVGGRPGRWRRMPLAGVRWRALLVEPDAEATVFLIHAAAGRRFPAHLHLGREDVVVLSGAYQEPGRRTAAGDFRSYPPASTHAPRVEAEEDCWLVARVERGVRFTGWRGLLQRARAVHSAIPQPESRARRIRDVG